MSCLPRMTGVVPTDCLIIQEPSAMWGMSFSMWLRTKVEPFMYLCVGWERTGSGGAKAGD